MPDLPEVGTLVRLRYRLPSGSVPPLSDVVGHLIDVGPTLRVMRSCMPPTSLFRTAGFGSRVWRRENASSRWVSAAARCAEVTAMPV